MKANELMIGDWVIDSYGGFTKIQYIHTCENVFHEMCYMVISNSCASYVEQLKPIPLTEEILKANGFDAYEVYTTCFYSKEVGNYVIVFRSDNGCPILTVEDVTDLDGEHNLIQLKDEIYNVHELLHALRVCGLNELADNFKIK